jgi:hypothetical protein
MPDPLRPLTAGELIDRALTAARTRFWSLLVPALPIAVLAGLIDIAYTTASLHQTWAVLPITFLLSGLAESLAIAAAYALNQGDTPGTRRSWAMIRPRLIAATVGYSLKWFMAYAGMVLLLAPGVYLLCVFFAVPLVSVTEGLGFKAAQTRSHQLARKHLTRIFLSIGLVETALLVGNVIFTYAAPAIAPSVPPAALTIVTEIVGLILLPFRAVLTVLVYQDCLIRSEGYDLERDVLETEKAQ